MAGIDTLRGRFGQFLEQRKLQSAIALCLTQIEASPNDVTPLQRLADLYLANGRTEDAINSLTGAAERSRADGRLETALALYRKAERVAAAERRVHILRRMIPINHEMKAFPQVFQLAREVVEFYLANGQEEVAVGFLKQLPALGDRDSAYRNQLGNLIAGRSGTWTEHEAKGSWRSGPPPSVLVREDFTSMTILLVDDEPAQLKLYARALEQLGSEIQFAENGLEAIERIRARRPSLVIADLVMPKMDGAELFDTLQADPSNEAIPFVCLSAQSEESELVAALERGVEDYWTKPIRPKELRARVKRLLRRIKDYAVLSGSLAEMGVPDLLQMLESNQRTGSLLLESGGHSAMIYIVDGRPMDATAHEREGEEAVYSVIDWRDGKFQFSPRLPERRQRIFTNAQGLLLEAIRRFDEEQHAIEGLPEDRDVRLLLPAKEIAAEDLPEGTTPMQLAALRPLLNGKFTLGEILDRVRGRLEMVQILAWAYETNLLRELNMSPFAISQALLGTPAAATPTPGAAGSAAADGNQPNPFELGREDDDPFTPFTFDR